MTKPEKEREWRERERRRERRERPARFLRWKNEGGTRIRKAS